MMLHTKYLGSGPCGFRQEIFFMFPYIRLSKTCDPMRAHSWRQGIIRTNLVEVYLMMLHIKYQGSRPCCFRQGF